MSRKITLGLEKYSSIHLLVFFIIIFGIWSPNAFLTMSTAHVIASQQSVAGIVALALLVPMVAGQFDLAIGATANLCGLVAVELQLNSHWSVIPSVIVAVLVGALVGATSGLIVVKLGVDSFIATLGMSSVLTALTVIVTNNTQPPPVPSLFFNNMTQHQVAGFQIVVLYLIVLAFLLWWVLGHTPLGRYLYATGNNPEAARLSGIQTGLWSWLSLLASGTIAAFAGCLYISLTGPTLTFGATMLLPSFAAVFLGSTQLQPGRFNVWGTLLAMVVLAVGVQGLQLVSGIQWIQSMFNGVALIVAVALSMRRGRGFLRFRRRGPSRRHRGPAALTADANNVSTDGQMAGTPAA